MSFWAYRFSQREDNNFNKIKPQRKRETRYAYTPQTARTVNLTLVISFRIYNARWFSPFSLFQRQRLLGIISAYHGPRLPLLSIICVRGSALIPFHRSESCNVAALISQYTCLGTRLQRIGICRRFSRWTGVAGAVDRSAIWRVSSARYWSTMGLSYGHNGVQITKLAY